MCSRKACWLLGAALACAAAVHAAETPAPQPAAAPITPASIDSAVAELALDPNLGHETRVRKLKMFKDTKQEKPSEAPKWVTGLFEYLSQFFGVLLWVAGAIAVAFAAVFGLRLLLKQRARTAAVETVPIIGQTFDLDLRPDSLPADVGAAALELSRAGNIRGCLSLLYRAALSRAVSRFGAVIGPALTEREALTAVKASLDAARSEYLADLIRIRQRVVYAGEVFAPGDVAPLCTRFDEIMNAGVDA